MAKPSTRRDPALLLDMVLAARDALSFIEGLDEAAFMASDLHQSAVIRCLEIVGEAARNVSPATRATLPDLAWSAMIGMRDRLIHGYREVNLTVVWRTARDDLAPLIVRLAPLIPSEGELGM